jgi:hypothetical protein
MTTMRNPTNRDINLTRARAVGLAALIIAAMLSQISVAASPSDEPPQQAASRDEGGSRALRCSPRTIRGSYGSHIKGTFILPPPAGSTQPPASVPLASVGRLVFDGVGAVSGTDTNSFGGTISTSAITGTYAVNEDCTGTLDVTFPTGFTVTNDIVIVDGGREIAFIQTNPGALVTGVFKRQ